MSLWYLPLTLKEKHGDLPRAYRIAGAYVKPGVLGVWRSLQKEIFTVAFI